MCCMMCDMEYKFEVSYCIKRRKSDAVGDIINDFYFENKLNYVYANDKHDAVEKFFNTFGFMNIVEKIKKVN